MSQPETWANERKLLWIKETRVRKMSPQYRWDSQLYSCPHPCNCYWSIMHRPREDRILSNRLASNALVKMSASYFSVWMYSSLIFLSSTRSRIKWCLISMCLVLLCWTWFLEILMVLMLSQNNVMTSCPTLYSASISFIHTNSVQLLPAAIYSDSAVDKEIQLCYLLNQEIRLFLR